MTKRGNCYVASEALYHLLGGESSGWKPKCTRLSWMSDTHWYLEHVNGTILDPTGRDQFTAIELCLIYDHGKGKGFLTKQPSKRAQILMGILLQNTRV